MPLSAPPCRLRIQRFPLLEMAQIGRRLVLLLGHQEPVAADEIHLLVDRDVDVALDAIVFFPGDILGVPPVILCHRPRPRERIVNRGQLIMQGVRVGLVQIEPFSDDGLVVVGHRHAGQVPLVRAPDVAGFDFERKARPSV